VIERSLNPLGKAMRIVTQVNVSKQMTKYQTIVFIIAVTPAAYKPAVEAITIYVTPIMLLFHIERRS
jgi:hypothetical protein